MNKQNPSSSFSSFGFVHTLVLQTLLTPLALELPLSFKFESGYSESAPQINMETSLPIRELSSVFSPSTQGLIAVPSQNLEGRKSSLSCGFAYKYYLHSVTVRLFGTVHAVSPR